MPESSNTEPPQTQIIEKVIVIKEVERSTLRPLNFLTALPIVFLLMMSTVHGFAVGSIWPFLLSFAALTAYYLLQKQIVDRLSRGVKVVALVEEPLVAPAPGLAAPVAQEATGDTTEEDGIADALRSAHWSEEPYPDPDEELDPAASA